MIQKSTGFPWVSLAVISQVTDTDLVHFPVLDPRYKLSYFDDAEWDPEWKQKAKSLMWDMYKWYKTRGDVEEVGSEADVAEEEEETEVRDTLLSAVQLTSAFL